MSDWDFSIERYRQQICLPDFGHLAQDRLKNSSVLVVGAGGIGCPLLMYLCSMGVGRITVVDGDRIEVSNLHRQILYDESDIGQLKVHVVKRKLGRFNPEVQVTAIDVFLTPDNAFELCEGHDVLLEGTDQSNVRLICDDVSRKLGIPYVYGSIHQMQAQVAVFNYSGSLSYSDFFPISEEQSVFLPTCANDGVLPAVAGMVGCLMAGECVKILTGTGDPLINAVMVIDFKTNQYMFFRKEEDNYSAGFDEYAIKGRVKTISPGQLQRWLDEKMEIQLLDVREASEREVFHIGGMHIPYSRFAMDKINGFRSDVPLVVYCQHGVRSAHVVEMFYRAGYQQVYSLAGGVAHYCKELEDL